MSEPDPSGERLQKVLARAGYGSRRACEELIIAGRVLVDGAPARLGQRVLPTSARVEVDGALVASRPGLVHYLVNKPPGILSASSDPYGRPVVVDIVPKVPRVFPVGRLDADTEGLLLVTNDGELALRCTHPSYGLEKEYLAAVEGIPSRQAIHALREGVDLEDGVTSPARVSSPAPGLLRIVIHEGRNRQVRRMCAAVGHPCLRLVRTRIGPLVDRTLAPGNWRELSVGELRRLSEATRPGLVGSEQG